MDRDLRAGHEPGLTALSWSLTIDPQEAFDRIVCPWAPWWQVALLLWPKAARRELALTWASASRSPTETARLRPSSPVPDRHRRSGFGGAQPAVTACGSTALQVATAWPSSRSPLPWAAVAVNVLRPARLRTPPTTMQCSPAAGRASIRAVNL